MVAAAALAAGLAGPMLAAAPAAAAITDTCGGAVSDYVGGDTLDAPFAGTVDVHGGSDNAFTAAPVFLRDNALRTEIVTGASDDEAVVDNFRINVDATGRGTLLVPTPWGEAVSNNVSCTAGTRVTKITGVIPAAGATFTLTRS